MSKTIAKRLKAAEQYIRKMKEELRVMERANERLVEAHQRIREQMKRIKNEKDSSDALLYLALGEGEFETTVTEITAAAGKRVVCMFEPGSKRMRIRREAPNNE